ncbi:MAG: hypothetical protein CUN53_00725 [Phototrophicales bacterium]|nr:MAG: hypothetical protein CUN53_00725 [Phototrophicales bacterium]
MFEKSITALLLEVELSLSSLQFPLLAQNVAPGVDVLSPAYIYQLICTLLGVKFLPHGVHFAVQSVQREKSLHEGAQLNIHYPVMRTAPVIHNPLIRTTSFRRHSLLIYLDQPQWVSQFQYSCATANPSLRRIERVTLLPMPARYVYAEGALLSSSLMLYVDDPIPLSLPRFIDNDRVFWDNYTVLRRRSLFMGDAWVDPSSERWCSAYRGVFWLNFVD